MNKYSSIKNVFSRSKETHKLIHGWYAEPEFRYLEKCDWVFREKINGTNIRIVYDTNGKVSFHGRTDRAQMPSILSMYLPTVFNDDAWNEFEDDIFRDACLYGEGTGLKIQGSQYGPEPHFTLFDVKIGHTWLKQENVQDIAEFFGLSVAPVVLEGTLKEGIGVVQEGLSSIVNQQYNNNFSIFAEGLVGRPIVDLCDRRGRRILTKIKHRDFYLRDLT